MAKRRKSPDGPLLLNQQQITKKYGIGKAMIRKHFPKAQHKTVRARSGARWTIPVWTEEQVEQTLRQPFFQEHFEQVRRMQAEARQLEEIRALFAQYSPDAFLERGKALDRVFVLHVGPTNSGKTYEALEDLKRNTPGTYLGPLRLLALEMFDKLNEAGVPCSMLTGEESIPVENARVVSSTIELCDYRSRFKTAVIDEAQLIADPSRGAAWLKAICLVNAQVVHICMAPEALDYVEGLVRQFTGRVSVVRHERLSPLEYAGVCKGLRDLQPDDGVICFSRKSVLSTAALLEKQGFRASVIYGALPPEARRSEVRKYLAGENNIVVATDAIGLGISLPIRRIVFAETEKFDGRTHRPLSAAEVKQIAGRAGRYGLHERGQVLNFGDTDVIREGLERSVPRIKAACLGFPREALESEYPLALLLRAWQSMKSGPGYIREDMQEAEFLLRALGRKRPPKKDRALLFDLITCPVDTRTEELVAYWADCAWAILRGKQVPLPYFSTEDLRGCELQYKAYDIHHQMLRRIGVPDDCSRERKAICEQIALLMRQSKSPYIRRCRSCGKELKIGNPYNYCENCRRLVMGQYPQGRSPR